MRRILFGLGSTFAFVLLSGTVAAKEPATDRSELWEGDQGTCEAVTNNLVMNCGFETNSFAPWVQSGDTSFTGIDMPSAHSGQFGLDTGPVTDLGYITQNLATGDQGAMHHLSFWLRNLGGTPNRFRVTWEGNVLMDVTDMPAFDYTRYDFDVFACGGTSELKFGFMQAPAYFHFDDVVVVRSTDP
jgi:hypothetical protein